MPLFGNRALRPPAQDKPPWTPEMVTQQAQSTRRRGLFGRIGSAITPDRMMIAGQMLRDIGTGENNLPDLIAAQREQPFRDMQMQAAKQEIGDAQTQRASRQQQQAMIEQYIVTLPPEQQAQARVAATLDPEGFAERMQGGQWEGGAGFTNAHRINPQTGQVELGGALPLRPRAVGGGSSRNAPGLPDGFEWED